jgi:hypothetical protein
VVVEGDQLSISSRDAGVDDRLYVLQGVVDRVTYPSLKGGVLQGRIKKQPLGVSMNLILVSGKAQAGKDTFYMLLNAYLRESFPDVSCQRFAFADALKSIATKYGWAGGKAGEGRSFLIDVGQILRGDYERDDSRGTVKSLLTGDLVTRNTYDVHLLHQILCLDYKPSPDFRVKQCARSIRGSTPILSVVTDWRFPNEGEDLRASVDFKHVTTVRIERLGGTSERVDDPSETGLDSYEFDSVVKNPGTVAGYEKEIEEWFDAYWSIYADQGLPHRSRKRVQAQTKDLTSP